MREKDIIFIWEDHMKHVSYDCGERNFTWLIFWTFWKEQNMDENLRIC